jgi:prolyl-tRNA synthetase
MSQAKKPRTAITPTREDNFPEWYQQVIKAADLAENSPVRGCMTIKPYGFALWENLQKALDALIKAEEVQNAYFPLLIPLSYIAKEAEHIDGFAKECAVVTHHRLKANADGVLAPDPESALTEPMIIRPTSETIIGEAMANWISSYRDLPMKLNQWANVMRWEMRPRIFLRTTEFLWQEGHNAFATADEADADARLMLTVYNNLFENYMAVPAIAGAKTPGERFPGAIETYTLEAFMQDGKALQGCTSHNLGQTFSKSANIKYLSSEGQQELAWTTSWGLSTRTMGAMIMVHADDDGMVMPPRLAPYQVEVLPFIRGEDDREQVLSVCDKLQKQLQDLGVRARTDKSDARSSDKMWNAIKKGVPIRVEVGAREIAEGKVTWTRRDLGKDGKEQCGLDDFAPTAVKALEAMHQDLFRRAQQRLQGQIIDVRNLAELRDYFVADHRGGVKIDYALVNNSTEFNNEFNKISKEFAVTCRCLPFEDEGKTVIVAKAY